MSTTSVPLREMIYRTAAESDHLRREVEHRFDGARISDYVRSIVAPSAGQSPAVTQQQDLFAAMNEACRRRSGQSANGTWIPFELLTRDLTAANSPALHTATMGQQVAPRLLPSSTVVSSGATVLTGLVGREFHVTSVSGVSPQGAAVWVAEGNAGPTLDPTIEVVKMTPSLIIVETVVSRRLLKSTEVDIDQLIRHELARHIGLAIDAAALVGDGVDKPLGLLNYPSLDVMAAGPNGAELTYQHLVDIEHRVRSRVQLADPSFTLSPALVRKLRTTPRNGAGSQFVMENADLMGYAANVSAHMPDDLTKGTGSDLSALLFGDLSELVIGFWGPAAVDFLVDPHTHSKHGDVRIIARVDVGIVPRQIAAFSAFKDLAR